MTHPTHNPLTVTPPECQPGNRVTVNYMHEDVDSTLLGVYEDRALLHIDYHGTTLFRMVPTKLLQTDQSNIRLDRSSTHITHDVLDDLNCIHTDHGGKYGYLGRKFREVHIDGRDRMVLFTEVYWAPQNMNRGWVERQALKHGFSGLYNLKLLERSEGGIQITPAY